MAAFRLVDQNIPNELIGEQLHSLPVFIPRGGLDGLVSGMEQDQLCLRRDDLIDNGAKFPKMDPLKKSRLDGGPEKGPPS